MASLVVRYDFAQRKHYASYRDDQKGVFLHTVFLIMNVRRLAEPPKSLHSY